MSKVLVTGGAGFIGSHLVDGLINNDHQVFVVDNLSSGKLKNVNKKARLIEEDIKSEKFVELLGKVKPEIIFHFAAQSSISVSFKNPQEDFQINLISTMKLLEKAQTISVKKIIFASSAAIYGEAKRIPLSESQPKDPISFYGTSKLCSEFLIINFFKRFKIPYTTLRFANVYGPRQNSESEGGVVAIFINNLLKKRPLIISGDGSQTRDFIYVADVIDACIKSQSEKVVGEFNVGTSRQTSINKLSQLITNLYHNGERVEKTYEKSKFSQVKQSCLSFNKLQKIIGFEPKVGLGEGISKTFQYFRLQK